MFLLNENYFITEAISSGKIVVRVTYILLYQS